MMGDDDSHVDDNSGTLELTDVEGDTETEHKDGVKEIWRWNIKMG